MSEIDRRAFLGTAAAAGISQPLLGSSALANPAQPPTLGPYVRRAVSGLAANDPYITGYATAVATMKALPSTDPTSWAAQAAIHGPGFMFNGVLAGPCHHDQWFWVWHRMYLYWFERIVRLKSGVPYWSLPYWDYDWQTTVSPAVQRQIPAPLRDMSSTLYDATRYSSLNSGGSLSPSVTATPAVIPTPGMMPPSYYTAQSGLQQTPHNDVHNAVGGNMLQFPTAGLDPLFWLHHCEIDRLWNLWLAAQAGRNDPVGDTNWKAPHFSFFDENGNAVSMTPCQALNAAQQLDYVYEFEPNPVNQFCSRIRYPYALNPFTVINAQAFVLAGGTQTLPFSLSEEVGARLVTLAKNPVDTLILQLANVEADAEPGALWEAYVGQKGRYKLDPAGPNFVGNVSLFGMGVKGESDMPAELSLPINRALGKKFDPSTLEITFVPSSGIVVDGVPVPPDIKAPITIGQINLLVETRSA